MFKKYFQQYEVKSEFKKEFISIFDGWLGTENIHRLDEVTKDEWGRFNDFVRLLHQNHRLCIVDVRSELCTDIDDIESVLSGHDQSLNKQSSDFTKIVIPDQYAVLTEEWDYTWILWHTNNGAVETLSPLIDRARLFHWRD